MLTKATLIILNHVRWWSPICDWRTYLEHRINIYDTYVNLKCQLPGTYWCYDKIENPKQLTYTHGSKLRLLTWYQEKPSSRPSVFFSVYLRPISHWFSKALGSISIVLHITLLLRICAADANKLTIVESTTSLFSWTSDDHQTAISKKRLRQIEYHENELYGQEDEK